MKMDLFQENAMLYPSNQRTPHELYIKLLVVHLTVLAAYGNLSYIRESNRTRIFRLLVFVCCPLLTVWFVVGASLAVLVQTLLYRRKEAFIRAVAILFGRLASEDDLQNHSQDWNEKLVTWAPNSWRKVFWVLLPQCMLLIQCIGSIYLFHHRVQFHAVALYDYRILQLDIGGLCTAVLTIVHILFEPKCPLKIKRAERWLRYIQPRLSYIPTHRMDELPYNASLVLLGSSDFLLGADTVLLILASDLRTSVLSSRENGYGRRTLWKVLRVSSSILFILTTAIVPQIFVMEEEDSEESRGPIGQTDRVETIKIFFICGFLALGFAVVEYWHLFTALWINKSYEQKWQDPQADWVWWLA